MKKVQRQGDPTKIPNLSKDMQTMDSYPLGFEEDDRLRSAFIRDLTLQQLDRSMTSSADGLTEPALIPKTLIRYWHDPCDLPDDVRACLNSWDRLGKEGFEFRMFDDASAAAYIAGVYGAQEGEAFARCRHPAMRSDYLRMCFVLAEGGLYVDADDMLLGEGWRCIFRDGRLKVQPLCYDIPSSAMVPAAEIWRADLPTSGRIFYVNNDPIATPPNHPVLRRALARATEKLLGEDRFPEIQSTTGPGNFTAALAAHAQDLEIAGAPLDFELLRDWEAIAETRFLRRSRNKADAEDLTHDVFVRLTRLDPAKELLNAEAFIFQTATNLLRDRARRAQSHGETTDVGQADLELGPGEPGPERVLQAKAELKLVMAALDALGEKTRNIFVLRRLEQMKCEEIASFYGISISAVEVGYVQNADAGEPCPKSRSQRQREFERSLTCRRVIQRYEQTFQLLAPSPACDRTAFNSHDRRVPTLIYLKFA